MKTLNNTLSALLMASSCLVGAAIVVNTLPAAHATPSAPVISASKISSTEAQDLAFMREEEQLAHDVYVALYQKWKMPIFNNISKSEATHTAQVKALLDAYGIADPLAGKTAGQFANPELQKLYIDLVAQGSQSLDAALKVGVAIEELDIKDLDARIAHTSNPDILRVYQNLKRGSENHLKAFTKQG